MTRLFLLIDAGQGPRSMASCLPVAPGNLYPMDESNLSLWADRHLLRRGHFGPYWIVEAQSADAARAAIENGGAGECGACGGLGQVNTSASALGRGNWQDCERCAATGTIFGRILESGGAR